MTIGSHVFSILLQWTQTAEWFNLVVEQDICLFIQSCRNCKWVKYNEAKCWQLSLNCWMEGYPEGSIMCEVSVVRNVGLQWYMMARHVLLGHQEGMCCNKCWDSGFIVDFLAHTHLSTVSLRATRLFSLCLIRRPGGPLSLSLEGILWRSHFGLQQATSTSVFSSRRLSGISRSIFVLLVSYNGVTSTHKQNKKQASRAEGEVKLVPPASSSGACHSQFPLLLKSLPRNWPSCESLPELTHTLKAFLKWSRACCFGDFFVFVSGCFCELVLLCVLSVRKCCEGYGEWIWIHVAFCSECWIAYLHTRQNAIMMLWVLWVHWEVGMWCVGVLCCLTICRRGSKNSWKDMVGNWELLTTTSPRWIAKFRNMVSEIG